MSSTAVCRMVDVHNRCPRWHLPLSSFRHIVIVILAQPPRLILFFSFLVQCSVLYIAFNVSERMPNPTIVRVLRTRVARRLQQPGPGPPKEIAAETNP